jgi:hypothetical protein
VEIPVAAEAAEGEHAVEINVQDSENLKERDILGRVWSNVDGRQQEHKLEEGHRLLHFDEDVA